MSEEESNLEKELSFSPDFIWEKIEEDNLKEVMGFAEGYKEYLSFAKTERKAVDKAIEILEKNGFKSIDDYKELDSGDKVYIENRNKAIAIAVLGDSKLKEGCNILASHIDSPRLDLKARPLYEDKDSMVALFKTHYYGGIKKYQWVSTPLAMYGRIVKEDGECIDVSIGDDDEDPVFVISDLLPHLSKKQQGDRKMRDVIKGEELNIIVGSTPIDDEDVDSKLKVKILKLLKDKYDVKEEDFVSAEIEFVPAGRARDIGLDKSLLGGYGQDDRICGYTSFMAGIDIKSPKKTSLIVLFDKEEIGSVGNTGAGSTFLNSVFCQLLAKTKKNYTMEDHRQMVENSKAMSGDCCAAVNPSFKGVHEMNNAAKMGLGLTLVKFTGGGGKYSANDAHAEYVADVRKIMNDSDIFWQTSELGKVDEGGGGTVARFIANMNIDTIDAGPPLLGMHAPFEVVSKADLYYTYKGYKAFLESE